MAEHLKLFFLSFAVKWQNFVAIISDALRYYRYVAFRNADIMMMREYLLKNPYAISRRFLVEKGSKDPYTYGETPLTTMETIVKKCNITSDDTVFELGCGRGRTVFWLGGVVGCQTVGIDYIPNFIETAQHIAERCGMENVAFKTEDMADADLSCATVIYLYGTCLDDIYIKTMIEKFPLKVKIITVSYPLTDYIAGGSLRVVSQFPVKYPWGKTTAYLHVKS